jgi:hypothetical protein
MVYSTVVTVWVLWWTSANLVRTFTKLPIPNRLGTCGQKIVVELQIADIQNFLFAIPQLAVSHIWLVSHTSPCNFKIIGIGGPCPCLCPLPAPAMSRSVSVLCPYPCSRPCPCPCPCPFRGSVPAGSVALFLSLPRMNMNMNMNMDMNMKVSHFIASKHGFDPINRFIASLLKSQK